MGLRGTPCWGTRSVGPGGPEWRFISMLRGDPGGEIVVLEEGWMDPEEWRHSCCQRPINLSLSTSRQDKRGNHGVPARCQC